MKKYHLTIMQWMRNILIMPGCVDYNEALRAQERAFTLVLESKVETVSFILEHDHVYTAGVNFKDEIQDNQVIRVNRGGELTYHGPGQVILYPILNTERHFINIRGMVAAVQGAIVSLLSEFGIEGESKFGRDTGIWVRGKKIASTGFHISRSVTMHGTALNVNTDLSYFNKINPCGFPPDIMTSMERILGFRLDMENIKRRLWRIWAKTVDIEDYLEIYSIGEFLKISEQLSEIAPSKTE